MSEEIVCPSCRKSVWAERRKLPGEADERGLVSFVGIAFGNFCSACSFRLPDDLSECEKPSVDASEPDEDVEEAPAPKPRKVVPIRKPESDDLFARIPREYEEAVKTERDAIEASKKATERREKLERLMTAIGLPVESKEAVAAE